MIQFAQSKVLIVNTIRLIGLNCLTYLKEFSLTVDNEPKNRTGYLIPFNLITDARPR